MVLGFLDTVIVPLHLFSVPSLPYSFLISSLLLLHRVQFTLFISWPAPIPFYTSILGSTWVQSPLVGLPARFPSGHGIKSMPLTLMQPDCGGGNQVSLSFPPSLVHAHMHAHISIYVKTHHLCSCSPSKMHF